VTPSTALLRREHTVVELVEWSAVPRRMVLVWGALFLNVLAFYGVPILVPIPATIGQMLAQGALPVALGLALIVNRNLVVRPSLVLALLSVGAITGWSDSSPCCGC
jgi:polyferredoxin